MHAVAGRWRRVGDLACELARIGRRGATVDEVEECAYTCDGKEMQMLVCIDSEFNEGELSVSAHTHGGEGEVRANKGGGQDNKGQQGTAQGSGGHMPCALLPGCRPLGTWCWLLDHWRIVCVCFEFGDCEGGLDRSVVCAKVLLPATPAAREPRGEVAGALFTLVIVHIHEV